MRKTVRHYHKLGLVAEPERDTSGFRRYGSTELLRLVQVRTLAAAGVPLAEIEPMLDADPTSFATALADTERQLTTRIAPGSFGLGFQMTGTEGTFVSVDEAAFEGMDGLALVELAGDLAPVVRVGGTATVSW